MNQPIPDAEMLKNFNQTIIDEFRANGGKVGGQFAGAELLLLHTIGARSGQPRVSPLAYFRIDGKLIVIGSFAGAPVSPAWVHNLRANPAARVEVGSESGIEAFDVTARELPSAERDGLFAKITAASTRFAGYQANTSRVIPLFELQRA
jgi:deazaflavin-dependent oxidoreductase (nitroreductase family)